MNERPISASAPSETGAEYLTFQLGDEEYGLDILNVQEIRGYGAVTHIANSPDYVKGVINMRGVIVPIIDMRIRFNLGEATYNEFTIVIILNIGARVIGMVVDAVSDVTLLHHHQIHPAPEFGAGIDTKYIVGLATVDEQMIIIVDIDQLMNMDELYLVEQAAA